ncbi:MAG: methyl-accepting chemotaxis protein [Pseudomonadota bacterium]
MTRLSIGARLVTGFALVVALSVVLSLFQLANFRSAIRFVNVVTTDDVAALAHLNEIIRLRSQLRAAREAAIAEAALAVTDSTRGQLPRIAERYAQGSKALLARIGELEKVSAARTSDGASAERRRLWSELSRTAGDLRATLEAITGRGSALLELLRQGDLKSAVALRREIDLRQEALERELNRSVELVEMLTSSGRRDILAAYDGALDAALVAILAVVLMGAGATWVIGRSITVPLARFVALVNTVGQGDLTSRVPEEGRGELGTLGRHLNGMAGSLSAVAAKTRSVAEELSVAVNQIRASAQQQAASVAEQLSAVEETNATVAEITQSGAQITGRAQEVERNALVAAGGAEQGLRAVESTVQAMDAIRDQVEATARTIVSLSERTQAIGEIILTVNAIAERAHLLALNASIEAAAAGEHGRTFSVVAGEIKRLADQSRDATAQVRANLGEIQQGINSSVMLTEEVGKRVEAGLRQSDATDRTIRTMADNIHESVQAFQQIVAATNQHQIGLEQVQQALQSIRQGSSQTATTTRQLEGAANNLSRLSKDLLEETRNFRL